MRNGRPGERDLHLALRMDVGDVLPEQPGDVRRDRPAPRWSRPRAPPGTCCAAASTAAPPRLWPIRIAGARYILRRWFAAATRSATLEENVVLANSPSLAPSPVKSKRSTAMPRAVSPSAMRFAASTSLPQVKQCANSANATGWPGRPVEQRGELLAARIGKVEAFGRHAPSYCLPARPLQRGSAALAQIRLGLICRDGADHIGIIVGPDALAGRRARSTVQSLSSSSAPKSASPRAR